VKTNSIAETHVGRGLIVHVRYSAADIWEKYRQRRYDMPEACGILISSLDMDGTRIWIDAVTKPFRGDVCCRHSFRMRDKGHQKALEKHYRKSGGRQFLLGTWHTHPQSTPLPSITGRSNDFSGWRKVMKSNPLSIQFCFAVVGTKENKLYVPMDNGFVELKCIQTSSNGGK